MDAERLGGRHLGHISTSPREYICSRRARLLSRFSFPYLLVSSAGWRREEGTGGQLGIPGPRGQRGSGGRTMVKGASSLRDFNRNV